jgi:hypothetical protein
MVSRPCLLGGRDSSHFTGGFTGGFTVKPRASPEHISTGPTPSPQLPSHCPPAKRKSKRLQRPDWKKYLQREQLQWVKTRYIEIATLTMWYSFPISELLTWRNLGVIRNISTRLRPQVMTTRSYCRLGSWNKSCSDQAGLSRGDTLRPSLFQHPHAWC